MKKGLLPILLLVGLASTVGAGSEPVRVTVSLEQRIGPMEIDKFALGQGGLSPEPMWDNLYLSGANETTTDTCLSSCITCSYAPEAPGWHFALIRRYTGQRMDFGSIVLGGLHCDPQTVYQGGLLASIPRSSQPKGR